MLTKLKYYLAAALAVGAYIVKLVFDRKNAELDLSKTKAKVAETSNEFYRRKTRAEEVLERQQAKERANRTKSFEEKKRDQLDNDW